MLGAGTTVWGPLYVVVALVVLVLVVWLLVDVWRRFVKSIRQAIKANVDPPNPVLPVILTVLIVGGSIVAATLAWNAMMDVTTSSSSYVSPAERQEQKRVEEAQPPTAETMDQARTDLKQRTDAKHEKAIESFDSKMAKEADIIRQRNAATQSAEKK